MVEEFGLSLLVYIVGGTLFILLFGEESEDHEIVWWPITTLKYLIRGLYLVLFTGWRNT